MRTFLVAIAIAIVAGCHDTPTESKLRTVEKNTVNKISKAQLEEMFANIKEKTTWDMNGDMLWGYFFTDADRSALERAAKKLEAESYRYVKLFQPEDDGKPLSYFFLHVEKVETHTVDSLYNRNSELEAFARQNDLDSYDGMDVGPVVTTSKKK